MPNWCDNSVSLYHADKSKIDALAEEMSKKNEDGHSMAQPFQHLRPSPGGEWDYDWSVSNWGTKWDASIIDWSRDDDNNITIYFESAWSPPTTLYEYLAEEGWGVEAMYHEPGMGFAGMYTDAGGDEYYEYDVTSKSSIDELPSDLIDFAGLENAHQDWIISDLEETWGDAERTEWHSVDVAPERDGYYEVTTEGWDFPQFMKWDGGCLS